MTVEDVNTPVLIAELLDRIDNSNGLDLCRREDIIKLRRELTDYLAYTQPDWAEAKAAEWDQAQS